MRRLYVICYDIADRRRLARVAKVMEGFGERVQESLFECQMDEGSLRTMQHAVASIWTLMQTMTLLPAMRKDVAAIQVDGVKPAPGNAAPVWKFL
ncbi:MAG: CRISPR-associated endonuclease Cas2 [Hydrogenophilales bacterium]|nr:CRISPR-associated endonuclease Cas2 [Hydrogenophilales bacterium]